MKALRALTHRPEVTILGPPPRGARILPLPYHEDELMIPGTMYAVSRLYGGRRQEWIEWERDTANRKDGSTAHTPARCAICRFKVNLQLLDWLDRQPGSVLWPTNFERMSVANRDASNHGRGYPMRPWAPAIETFAQGPRMGTRRRMKPHEVSTAYAREFGNSDFT